MDHLSIEQLANFAEGRLGRAETEPVVRHLKTGCSECQATLAWLRSAIPLMANDRWLEPPAELKTSVRQMFQQRQPPVDPAFSIGEWLRVLFSPPLTRAVAVAAVLALLLAAGLLLQNGWGSVAQTAALEASGPVEVLVAGQETWQPAATGQQL
ncbi:MAG: hypothetical protein L0331_23915, partial [Chloroflexi bacterium]|nr:hypothetical protein [Chloroflexota bacterium]